MLFMQPVARWDQMTTRGETFLSHEPMIAVTAEPSLASKVTFLSRPDAYGEPTRMISCRETHMSWVFLAGDCVFKLKKPVRFAYLDFSTLSRREAACRAELKLNRRLAADVYLSVVPLVWTPRGLAIGGSGVTVDWLVVMRRLDEASTLERMLLDRRLTTGDLDRLVATLAAFYRHAGPVRITPARHFAELSGKLGDGVKKAA
jgi:aminoglycoside phosphotransferase family enzyme